MTKAIIIGLVVIFVVMGFAIFMILRSRTIVVPNSPGFREMVKNPDMWRAMQGERTEADRLAEEAATCDPSELGKYVERYVFGAETSNELWALARQLEARSPQTNDALLAILKDESRQAELVQLRPGNLLEEAPIMRVCTLFEGNQPVEAIELLTPYLSHASEEIRKECALAIAESGLAEALPAIQEALRDEDEYVCSYALIGMERAVMEERLSPEIRSGIVGDLEKVVLSDREVKKAAQLLSRIDPKQAETFLLSDRVMDTESGSLHEVLGVIGEFDFPIPREKVKSLVATYAGREMEYPNTYALGESLELLGKFQNREDEELLLEYADHDEDRVSDGAAAGLLAFHGLEDFQECMWEQEEAGGWESLNHQQQLYLAVFLLNAEVNNGGHSQYFFNSTGDSWPLALEGLQTMGFRKRLQIFEGVLELFGDQKPLTDRDKRLDQLAKVFRQNEDAFDAFDSQYYAAEESFDVYSMRFVIQNADKFSERPADTP